VRFIALDPSPHIFFFVDIVGFFLDIYSLSQESFSLTSGRRSDRAFPYNITLRSFIGCFPCLIIFPCHNTRRVGTRRSEYPPHLFNLLPLICLVGSFSISECFSLLGMKKVRNPEREGRERGRFKLLFLFFFFFVDFVWRPLRDSSLTLLSF